MQVKSTFCLIALEICKNLEFYSFEEDESVEFTLYVDSSVTFPFESIFKFISSFNLLSEFLLATKW